MNSELVLNIPNDLHAVEDVVDYVVARCPSCEEDARKLNLNFRVGLTEALSNAILYGNGRDPAKTVRLEVAIRDSRITVQVTDQGNGFDPERVPDPTCPVNRRKIGGRGLFLMRELMDEVRFNDRGNSVTLVLRLSSGERVGGGAQA